MMRVPERPEQIEQLDLLKRVGEYVDGKASWLPSGQTIGERERRACHQLHANIIGIVDRCFQPLMDKIGAREMSTFTMHDRGHGLKVAHLMWQILKPERRAHLTPVEIALLVISAHFHDLGMALNDEDRLARLRGDSDI